MESREWKVESGKKTRIIISAALLVLIGAVILLKDSIAERILVNSVRSITGVSIKVKRVHLKLFKGMIKVEGLHLLNPNGFPEKSLAEIPDLFVNIDLGVLLQGKVHLEEVRLNLEKLVILRKSDGQLNLTALRPIQEKQETAEKPKRKEPAKEFQLDYLRLSIGRVYYKDYRVGDSPAPREFDIGIRDQEYRDITDVGDLVRRIVSQALARTTLSELGDLEGVQRRLEKTLSAGQGSISEKTRAVLEQAKEALGFFQLQGSSKDQEENDKR